MPCPECGSEVPEGDKFCGKCGATMEEAPAAAESETQDKSAEPTSPRSEEPEPPEEPDRQKTPAESMAPTDTTDATGEREVWQGRYSNRAAGGGLLLTLVVAVLLVVVALVVGPREGWLRTAIWIASAVVVAVVLARVLWRWAKHRFTLRYRLTTERLFIDKGLFSRTRDEIELIRVDDVRVRQTLMERIFKVGRVEVISTDRTHGELVLVGIDEPDGVKEKIRQYMRARRKKSLHIESL